ncbi:MAG: methylthioribose-phosphate isomerase [Verrucomicrobiota bacterium]|nr:methylthioribose-phosphate isomerase [Verrucomicrobiota bacterium]MDK2962610.1 methylthioribose-phosphate isomerase [Verrucomicrobiota bacterium]
MNNIETKTAYSKLIQTIKWTGEELFLLDQTKLPMEVVIEKQESVNQVWDSIKMLKVRGAPAIGIAGGYGLVVAMRDRAGLDYDDFILEMDRQAAYLDSSRPTAVNLSWALKRIVSKVKSLGRRPVAELFEEMIKEAVAIHNEDRLLCRGIGESGKSLINDGIGILTHCNAGSLATSELGTATAPMYLAFEDGVKFRVYADETRPLLQGARLTSWELQQAGIDVTLICDNMAAFMMSKGFIDLVIVGADRVAANGDVANKIGTMGVALLAKHFNIPFYVACPGSTIDLLTARGENIEIEERDAEEVTFFGERRTGPEGIKVRNPAFDVTPNELITGLITEKGIIRPPFDINLKQRFGAAAKAERSADTL